MPSIAVAPGSLIHGPGLQSGAKCHAEKKNEEIPTSVRVSVGLNCLNILEPNPMFFYEGAWFCLLREPFKTHAVASASPLWILP